jgi:hypothetical protein
MQREAKSILEHVIKELDKSVPPITNTLESQVEAIDPNDEDELQEHLLYMQIISAGRQGTCGAVIKMLIGENILTPCLTRNGWKFWRQPLLTNDEKEAIEMAVVKTANAFSEKVQSLQNSLERTSGPDTHKALIASASLVDAIGARMQQLSAELKEIVSKA